MQAERTSMRAVATASQHGVIDGAAGAARKPLRAEFACYMSGGRIHIGLDNRCAFVFPVDRIERFAQAHSVDLRCIRLLDGGALLHWPRLGVRLTLASLMGGEFGSTEWMRRLRASSTEPMPVAGRSARKARASHGRTGGSESADPAASNGLDLAPRGAPPPPTRYLETPAEVSHDKTGEVPEEAPHQTNHPQERSHA
ncbi:DUF2442 domain-containing protein [Leptothrix discophora]|uniref:DUF2442 domain-containing protein n=1 Tax=Leptothrix discophora TaxID=89 RepID=A0ABT9G418_LEPDI|nr:DUF2442 domain-containing protein [Leptothrix discophora]